MRQLLLFASILQILGLAYAEAAPNEAAERSTADIIDVLGANGNSFYQDTVLEGYRHELIRPERRADLIAEIEARLSKTDPEFLENLIRALPPELLNESKIEDLVLAKGQDPSPLVRLSVLEKLEFSKASERSRELVSERLRDENPCVLLGAIAALTPPFSESDKQTVIEIMRDPPTVEEQHLDAAHHSNPIGRARIALSCFEKIGTSAPDETVPLLAALLKMGPLPLGSARISPKSLANRARSWHRSRLRATRSWRRSHRLCTILSGEFGKLAAIELAQLGDSRGSGVLFANLVEGRFLPTTRLRRWVSCSAKVSRQGTQAVGNLR